MTQSKGAASVTVRNTGKILRGNNRQKERCFAFGSSDDENRLNDGIFHRCDLDVTFGCHMTGRRSHRLVSNVSVLSSPTMVHLMPIFIIFRDSSYALYGVLFLVSTKWPITLLACKLNKLVVAESFINASVTEKHKDKGICIKCIQLLLFLSKSLNRVKCFRALPFTYLCVKEIKCWTASGFIWNKESNEELGGLFHFSLDQVSKNGPLSLDVCCNILLADKRNYAIVGLTYSIRVV